MNEKNDIRFEQIIAPIDIILFVGAFFGFHVYITKILGYDLNLLDVLALWILLNYLVRLIKNAIT